LQGVFFILINEISQVKEWKFIESKRQKSSVSVKKFLNMYGLFTIGILIATIYTHSITGNAEQGIFFDSTLMMSDEKITSLLFFLFIISIIYFTMINVFLKS